ncbi:MAG: efflux RND transporter periplasmic adaptor subunit [Bacteroidales bacterium]|nr:efflux RND transporter periplasmic adaptor subunit [Bacteroidales bacterium]
MLVIGGIFLGWLIFHQSKNEKTSKVQTVEEGKHTIWTCAMHPQIRMDKPGKCPICGMELIPLKQATISIDPDALEMTEEAIKLADVQTNVVTSKIPMKEVRLYGKIQADERLIQTQPAHIPGRIEKLLVNFTGEEVKKGQVIAQIYSPELITAQEELLEAVKMKDMQPRILEAAREKLRQWKLSDNQIAEIENSGNPKAVFDVYATVSGIVISRRVNVGDYISQGSPLFEIADLSSVWAMFDAYESDLPWIRKGDKISFTLQSLPGKSFSGTVSFIDPVINPQTRVARVRMDISNPAKILKPEMFATGIIKAQLETSGNKLIIPQSAVLWTGTRSIVYIKLPDTDEPAFISREVTLGPALTNSYVVLSGLKEGEEIVTNGTFSVDAAAQLNGKPSMMNTEGGRPVSGHNHGGMTMPAEETQPGVKDTKNKSETEQTTGKTAPITDKFNVSMDFTMQLNKVIDKYLILKNVLVAGEEPKVKQATKDLQNVLAVVDMKLLTGEAHLKWMEISDLIQKQTKIIDSSNEMEKQREAFILLSEKLHQAIKMYGLMGKTVYYQFCPMANSGVGAYWLSEFKDIRNPYYGEAMLTCGETKETLSFK